MQSVSELYSSIYSSIRSLLSTEHLLCASCWGYSMNVSDTLPAFLGLEVWQGKETVTSTSGIA